MKLSCHDTKGLGNRSQNAKLGKDGGFEMSVRLHFCRGRRETPVQSVLGNLRPRQNRVTLLRSAAKGTFFAGLGRELSVVGEIQLSRNTLTRHRMEGFGWNGSRSLREATLLMGTMNVCIL
jgi:hypothetical protein